METVNDLKTQAEKEIQERLNKLIKDCYGLSGIEFKIVEAGLIMEEFSCSSEDNQFEIQLQVK